MVVFILKGGLCHGQNDSAVAKLLLYKFYPRENISGYKGR